MMLISFRAKLTSEAGKDYDEMSAEMERLARSSPGFLDVRHLQAQRMGRAKWYQYYKLEVAEVVRQSDFQR